MDPLQSTTLRGIRSARSGLEQRCFSSSALHRKSCHASVSVMLEERGGRCRTDRPIRVLSCQMRHTIAANQGRVVSFCVEPPLGVRPTLPAARGSSQLATSSESLVTGAERSNRRVTCPLHIISDVTRVRHAQGTTLSMLRAFVACIAAAQTAVLVLFGPSCLGHYRPMQRRSSSDKCSVRCTPIKLRGNF